MLERASASGRLELRGLRAPGREHELVPDTIASDANTADAISAATEPGAAADTPQTVEGRIGTDLANVSWRFSVRQLGDAGR